MADVAVVRKRVRAAIEQARRDQAERRGRVAEAQAGYNTFLETAAIPAFRMIANVLKSEGLSFEVMTPAGGVRMQSERNREDAIEMELDTTADPPQPLVTITRTRGSRVVQSIAASRAATRSCISPRTMSSRCCSKNFAPGCLLDHPLLPQRLDRVLVVTDFR